MIVKFKKKKQMPVMEKAVDYKWIFTDWNKSEFSLTKVESRGILRWHEGDDNLCILTTVGSPGTLIKMEDLPSLITALTQLQEIYDNK